MTDCVKCPKCGSTDCGEIIYGLPTYELFKRAEAGEVKLGGCVIMEDSPDYFCRNCGHEWKKDWLPMTINFDKIFHSGDPVRDKFLSRLFGIFGEELVRYWCSCPQAPYEDLGRPTVYAPGEMRGHTLDFTLCHRKTGKIFVAEVKCELEFQNYRYLRLTDAWQLEHHRNTAFLKFLHLARYPESYKVKVRGHEVHADGAVLIWGSITPEGRRAVVEKYGFADVLSVEMMANDLRMWNPAGWSEKITQLRQWSNELFDSFL